MQIESTIPHTAQRAVKGEIATPVCALVRNDVLR